jgi:hypothetical protein
MEDGRKRRTKKKDRSVRARHRSSVAKPPPVMPQPDRQVGRLSEVTGSPKLRGLAERAHTLYWDDDLDGEEVVRALERSGHDPESIAWACRWGIPLGPLVLPRLFIMGLNRAFGPGVPRVSFGESICLLRSTGEDCPPWVLVAAGEHYSLGLSERLRIINALTPTTGAQMVASLRSVIEPPKQSGASAFMNSAYLSGSLGGMPTKDSVVDSVVRAGVLGRQEALDAWAGIQIEAHSGDDESAQRTGRLWTEAVKQREDGLERTQQAVERKPVDPSRPALDRSMLSDAYSALTEA